MSTTPTTPTATADAQALALHLSGTVALAIGDAIEGRKTVADVMAAVAQYGAAMRHLGDVSGAA